MIKAALVNAVGVVVGVNCDAFRVQCLGFGFPVRGLRFKIGLASFGSSRNRYGSLIEGLYTL